jgi:sporulation integral membrane protein YlbJ
MKSIESTSGIPPRRFALAGGLILGGTAILLSGLALGNAEGALSASLRGIGVWWEVLFPALFPFFVLSELLLGFGIVHFAGALLDPFMRPLFRLPGIGGFIVSMGFVSGYPVGARLTSRLMEQKLLTRGQGERLVAMTTTSDPIFLIGAVCIGFFGSLQPAPIIAIAHYSGALLIGLASRFGKSSVDVAPQAPAVPPSGGAGRLRFALAAMHKARLDDGRPLGVLLQQALQSSLALMMIVGGLVVFFSAALELLVNGGIVSALNGWMSQALPLLHLSANLSPAFMNGAFEVTLGAKAAALSEGSPLMDRAAVAAFVLSWAGFSVHAQVAGLMSGTAWRYWPFARARLVHGLLAMLLVYALWPLLGPTPSDAAILSAWALPFASDAGHPLLWKMTFTWPLLLFAGAVALLVAAGTIAIGLRKLRSL